MVYLYSVNAWQSKDILSMVPWYNVVVTCLTNACADETPCLGDHECTSCKKCVRDANGDLGLGMFPVCFRQAIASFLVLFFASHDVWVSLLNASICLMATVCGMWFVWHGYFQVNVTSV